MKEGEGYDELAARLSPGSGSAQLNWGIVLQRRGDWARSVDALERAARLDPLGQTAQWYHALALVETGRRDEARAALRAYFQRPIPESVRTEYAPSIASFLFGDLAVALVAAHRLMEADPNSSFAMASGLTEFRRLHGRQAAARYARGHDSLSALSVLDDPAAMRRRVAELGRDFWASDYDIDVAGQYLVARGFEADLLRSYDQARAAGMARDDDVFASEPLAVALRRAGRTGEATFVIGQLRRRIDRQRGREYRRLAYRWALLHALEGRTDAAFEALADAIANRSWVVNDVIDAPLDHVALADLRGDRRFARLVAAFESDIARERARAVGIERLSSAQLLAKVLNGPAQPHS